MTELDEDPFKIGYKKGLIWLQQFEFLETKLVTVQHRGVGVRKKLEA